jgi:aminopeptidase-like protein
MRFDINQHDFQAHTPGDGLHRFIEELYPICRSITGQGIRDTLAIIKDKIPLTVHQVPTGQHVFDWQIPKEWNIKRACIYNSKSEKVIDFADNNLHVVSYSQPVNAIMSLTELKPHLHFIEGQPDIIPYRTSYYHDSWGFCLSYNQYKSLIEDDYHVIIDSTIKDGVLNYGEYFVKGKSEEEVLLYTHICHPSLCNDNLSGISILAHLAQMLSGEKLNYSYRFIFAPGTIGAITWLSLNKHNLPKIKHGMVLALLGDSGVFHYKKNRNPGASIDKIVCKALEDGGEGYSVLDFSPYGYDERQFCSPGINLDFGRLTRTPDNCYPEYHTSADNLDFVKPEKLESSLRAILSILDIVECDKYCLNTSPECEPQLGKRGLYNKTGGGKGIEHRSLALLWVLNQSDGVNSLLDISIRSSLPFETINSAADDLIKCGLLEVLEKPLSYNNLRSG